MFFWSEQKGEIVGIEANTHSIVGPTVWAIPPDSIVVGSLAVLIGAQCISFAIIARRYAAVRGLLPPQDRIARLAVPNRLEPSLIVAAALALPGLGGLGWAIAQWWQADFGALAYGSLVRVLAVSCTLIALALQLAFTAFLAAIIDIGIDD